MKNRLVLLDGNKISGGINYITPECYSTEEKEVGCWIDGKPLYEKAVDISQYNVTLVNNAWNNVFALSNVDYLAQAIIHKNSPNTNHGLRFQANNGYIQGAATQQVTLSSLSTFYVTFQYTKSTDTAGSGTWTPSGIPAVHYSTEEHVIGTWIDGKTLYEKTFIGVSPSDNTSANIFDITSLNVENVVELFGNIKSNDVQTHTGGNSFVLWVRYNWSDNKDWIAITVSNSSYYNSNIAVTLRYTKSS